MRDAESSSCVRAHVRKRIEKCNCRHWTRIGKSRYRSRVFRFNLENCSFRFWHSFKCLLKMEKMKLGLSHRIFRDRSSFVYNVLKLHCEYCSCWTCCMDMLDIDCRIRKIRKVWGKIFIQISCSDIYFFLRLNLLDYLKVNYTSWRYDVILTSKCIRQAINLLRYKVISSMWIFDYLFFVMHNYIHFSYA